MFHLAYGMFPARNKPGRSICRSAINTLFLMAAGGLSGLPAAAARPRCIPRKARRSPPPGRLRGISAANCLSTARMGASGSVLPMATIRFRREGSDTALPAGGWFAWRRLRRPSCDCTALRNGSRRFLARGRTLVRLSIGIPGKKRRPRPVPVKKRREGVQE